MAYRLMVFVAFIGLALYFFGYTQHSLVMQVAGGILTVSMFCLFIVKRLASK